MTDAVSEALKSIRRSAEDEQGSKNSMTRVTVQVGHCSLAVGADEVVEAARETLPGDAYLVAAGCDGACFAGPKLSIMSPDGQGSEYWNVSADMVKKGIRFSATDRFALNRTRRNAAEFIDRQRRITLSGCGTLDALSLGEYVVSGGYQGLARALSMPPEEVIEEALASGLRGRGGAYFPAGLKWRGARGVRNTPRYLSCELRRGRAGHLQGPASDGGRAASSD